jgi:ATP-dependent DNA helicase RecQ
VPTDILHELGLAPEDTPYLSPRLRDRLIRFLLRWKHHAALDACLTELLAKRPLLSLLDVRARMLLEEGLLDEAWETICQRHQRSASIPSRILAARIRLAQHDTQTALATAKALVNESEENSMAWCFLGEVRLAAGDERAALGAYHRANDLVPGSRACLLGMMAVYETRGDWVTASAYAVRLQETATAESPLLVWYLRRLREYFQASKELNRVVDIDEELNARYAAELSALRETLALEFGPPTSQHAEHGTDTAPIFAQPPSTPAEPLDSFEAIPVSPQEQKSLKTAARRVFGFESLWPGQAEIMACTVRGEDVLAVLPTGGGKSLCYQLPALLEESGTTLVLSPLIALMKDQVDKLPDQVAHLATHINYLLGGNELRRRLRGVRAGRYRLVYAAPERLRQPPFTHALRQAGVNRLVIDEVHCVSMWGHDFRPDYLYLAEARHALGDPPLLAMTATAAPRVRRDILQRLGGMRIISGEVMRPNLRLEVFRARSADEKLRYLLAFCRSVPGSGIVYAGSRARCETLAELLRCQGVSAIHYHAGITDRSGVQDEFMSGRIRVVVATVAFGMGIDKPDIRFIVHYRPPPSLEAYYQEAGRAGRDGLPARCVLMYAPSDRATLTRHARQDVLPADFLRDTYAAVKRHLQGHPLGRVALDDLRRDLQAEDTPVRVAISMLQQVGLLRRWQDVPRSATLRVRRAAPEDEPDLATFCHTAHLVPGQSLERDLLKVAQAAGMDARGLEQRVASWADAGFLEYRPSARDPLLEVLPPPKDAREQIRTLLEQYESIQGQRVAEIVSYAMTRRCRHGHISAYLGGRPIAECRSCDNCLPSAPEATCDDLPDEWTQLQTILQAAAHGWGKSNLIRILCGHPEAPPSERDRSWFGALAFRSGTAIGHMIARLLEARLLETRQLKHGGVMLQLTPAGRRALADSSVLQQMTTKPPQPAAHSKTTKKRKRRSVSVPVDVAMVPEDDPLFQRLRAWRLETAREAGVAAFVVAHNSLLRNIAAVRPRTESELLAIKGMGPRKLEKYGPELLALVGEEAAKK